LCLGLCPRIGRRSSDVFEYSLHVLGERRIGQWGLREERKRIPQRPTTTWYRTLPAIVGVHDEERRSLAIEDDDLLVLCHRFARAAGNTDLLGFDRRHRGILPDPYGTVRKEVTVRSCSGKQLQGSRDL
jgi:hypothetical protein